MKEQGKTPGGEKNPSEIEISNLFNKDFPVMAIKMLIKLEWTNTVSTSVKRK